MASVTPRPPVLKAGNYDEPATYGDLTSIFKWLVECHVRPALTSPPLAKDVAELTFVYDRTLDRLYTKSNGVLKYVQFI